MKRVGYVLSGGGTRGFAHLGIIKYLEELKIYPHAISGTSAGSIAGSLYAAGKNPEEILKIMKDNIFFGWSSINFRQNGFLSMDMLRKVLKGIFLEDDFKALKMPFYATATDLNKGKEITFSEGPLVEAIIASCSVPVVFNSVQMGNHLLVDGGLVNNFPVEPLLSNCDIIIGSYVNKLEEGISNHSSFKIVNYMDRCFHLAISKNVYAKTHLCDVFIESPLHAYNMYDVKAADAIFEIGYTTARSYKDELDKLVQQLQDRYK